MSSRESCCAPVIDHWLLRTGSRNGCAGRLQEVASPCWTWRCCVWTLFAGLTTGLRCSPRRAAPCWYPPNGHRSTRRRMYWQMYWHVCSRPVQGQCGPGADLCHGETSCSRHCKRGAGPVALTSLAARESPARPRELGFALSSYGLEVPLLGLATARHRGIRERVLRTGAAASATGESSEAAAANTES